MNDQKNNQSGQSSMQGGQQGQQKQFTQSELENVIRGGKWNSQQDANQYLQKYGLTAQISDDGTAKIFQQGDQSRSVASVRFQGGQSDRQIGGIEYS
jgi:hypothetical protein